MKKETTIILGAFVIIIGLVAFNAFTSKGKNVDIQNVTSGVAPAGTTTAPLKVNALFVKNSLTRQRKILSLTTLKTERLLSIGKILLLLDKNHNGRQKPHGVQMIRENFGNIMIYFF